MNKSFIKIILSVGILSIATTECLANEIKDKSGTVYNTVVSPYTGKVWLDRNIGASRVCLSLDDKACYGDYFQWGRGADGHEKEKSQSKSTLSSKDTPTHSKFLKAPESPYDWRGGQNSDLWQEIDGANNPCPTNFRIPTIDELMAETKKQELKNSKDVYESFLKLPSAGYKDRSTSFLHKKGIRGNLWSSSTINKYSDYLLFNLTEIKRYSDSRANGFAVRCIKN
ncbi:MAG: hypothetical protein KAJ49_04940 [Arcobacteraceae bacterium]|nr:hypothetical protein [Arcobacteraceae bacterium]